MLLVAAVNPLSPNSGLIIWLVLVFLLFLFVLRKFAWGPITKSLREREDTIAASLARAEQVQAEARQLQEDNERARREAERQAQHILAAARDEATQLREREATKLKEELARLQAQAQADIEREKQQAIGQLRAEVANLAIGAAEKILKANLDAARQQKLVDAFIDGVPTN